MEIKFAFFGTSEFSVLVLEELKEAGFVPNLLITVPDKPSGRKLLITPPPAKVWAEKNGVAVLQPTSLKTEGVFETIKSAAGENADVFIVASYGKIIPQNILDIPKHGTLNVHPSLLPKLRGASPIQSAILSENETGVSIIKLDAEMDHGPILAQEKVEVEWPPYADDLEKILAKTSGKILSKILPDWTLGKIKETTQEHEKATFTVKIKKTDGEINLEDSPEVNLRKVRAYSPWPSAYFFTDGKRVIVKKAKIEGGLLVLERVLPEGSREMSYSDFLKGQS